MQTISQVLDHAIEVAGGHLTNAAESMKVDVTMVQQVFADVSKKSIGIATLGTAAGVYFAGRACCSTKLSTTQRVGSWFISAACLAAAGYEIYSNGVNLGLVTKL